MRISDWSSDVCSSDLCERDTEGASNALYGGEIEDDDSGRMSYVQIRYSGFNLSPDSELQGLTPSGVGSATQFDHIQMHNSSDDGMEVFGGRPNFKHRSEAHTSELQSLMRISYAVFCLQKKKRYQKNTQK